MFASILIHFFPAIFFLLLCLYAGRRRNLYPIPNVMTVIFAIIMVFLIALFPEEFNYDKPRYTSFYFETLHRSFVTVNYKDAGWPYYVFFCTRIFGRNVDLYYLLTAAFYMSGYYVFARRFFTKGSVGYFIIFSAGCLGFIAYGVNTIRSGVALSLLLYSISFYYSNQKIRRLLSILFIFMAILIHKSMAISLVAFVSSIYVKKIKYVVLFWFLCLSMSVLNVDLSEFFEIVGFIDNRIELYMEGNGVYAEYNTGFRIDFVIYSIVPMIICWYYIAKKKIENSFFFHLIKMYIFSNAVWLLAIRMFYTDRLAYLSWFLIPALLLIPVCYSQKKFYSPQNVVLFTMLVFMSLPLLLYLK